MPAPAVAVSQSRRDRMGVRFISCPPRQWRNGFSCKSPRVLGSWQARRPVFPREAGVGSCYVWATINKNTEGGMSSAAADMVKPLIPMSTAYKRIATEEAYAPAEMLERYRKLIDEKGTTDPGFLSQWAYFLGNASMMQKLASRFTDVG